MALNPIQIDAQNGVSYVPPKPPAVPTPAAPPTASQAQMYAQYYNSLNAAYAPVQQQMDAANAGNPNYQGFGTQDYMAPGSAYNQAWADYTRGQQYQNPTMPTGSYSGGGGGGGYGSYGGGGGSAAQQAGATNAMAYYQNLLSSGQYADGYNELLQGAKNMRARLIGQGRKASKKTNKRLDKAVGRATDVTKAQYGNLLDFLSNNSDNAFRGLRAQGAGQGDTSAALLADQGAGNTAVSQAQAEAASTAQGSDAAFNQMAALLRRNERSNIQGRYADARLGRGATISQLNENAIGARMGIANQLQSLRQDAWQQYAQQNQNINAQRVAEQQRIRDLMVNLAMQFGLEMPK